MITDTLFYVGEKPWSGLGTKYELAPKTSHDIVKGAKAGWEVDTEEMGTELHGIIPNYHAVYRKDNNEVLGVVNSRRPVCVQNIDAFQAFDPLMEKGDLAVETAATLGIGEKVFACFKLGDGYKIFDDEIAHYFVVFNDHLQPDGKVTVLNTPIRVVCENTLSEALSKNIYKARIPVTSDSNVNQSVAERIMKSVEATRIELKKKSEEMYGEKISKTYVEKLLDELFPYIKAEGETLHERANEFTTMVRDTFIDKCMRAPDLEAYAGTQLQVFQALTDFSQHYYKDVTKAYDLNSQMKKIPGMSTLAEPSKVAKFMKIRNKIAV